MKASRLTSTSDGPGAALSALVAEWAAHHPKIRRVWILGENALVSGDTALPIALELQPVGDSEETLPVWIGHCERWRSELQSRLGREVDLGWLDPDRARGIRQTISDEANALIYERSR